MTNVRRCLCATGLAIAATLAGAPAFAGSVSGPYLIWFNLANDASADSAIHDFTHTFDDDLLGHFDGTPLEGCWNPDALLLISHYPAQITPTLVRAAVLNRDPDAIGRLRHWLQKGDDDLPGYDGVIVVTHTPHPTVTSFSARGRIRSKTVAGAAGQPDWPAAFCAVLPPISRKP